MADNSTTKVRIFFMITPVKSSSMYCYKSNFSWIYIYDRIETINDITDNYEKSHENCFPWLFAFSWNSSQKVLHSSTLLK